jgi:hypothetical protein
MWALRCILFLVAINALSSGAEGDVTGNEWKTLAEGERKMYVIGVTDAWSELARFVRHDTNQTKRALTTPEKIFFFNVSCFIDRQMPKSQIIAIVDQYMTEHPAEWHEDMTTLVLKATGKACGRPN